MFPATEDAELRLDDYELAILGRSVKLYIAVQGVDRDEYVYDPANPDLAGNIEMTQRAHMLSEKIERIINNR